MGFKERFIAWDTRVAERNRAATRRAQRDIAEMKAEFADGIAHERARRAEAASKRPDLGMDGIDAFNNGGMLGLLGYWWIRSTASWPSSVRRLFGLVIVLAFTAATVRLFIEDRDDLLWVLPLSGALFFIVVLFSARSYQRAAQRELE